MTNDEYGEYLKTQQHEKTTSGLGMTNTTQTTSVTRNPSQDRGVSGNATRSAQSNGNKTCFAEPQNLSSQPIPPLAQPQPFVYQYSRSPNSLKAPNDFISRGPRVSLPDPKISSAVYDVEPPNPPIYDSDQSPRRRRPRRRHSDASPLRKSRSSRSRVEEDDVFFVVGSPKRHSPDLRKRVVQEIEKVRTGWGGRYTSFGR